MIQDIEPKKFNNTYSLKTPRSDDPVFVFSGTGRRNDKVLVNGVKGDPFPTVAELLGEIDFGDSGDKCSATVDGLCQDERFKFLFSIDSRDYYLYMHFGTSEFSFGTYELKKVRILQSCGTGEQSFAGMTAYHLFTWYRNNQFCGRCGSLMTSHTDERSLICKSCGNISYPNIAPAVIVGVRNGERLLLSRYAGREYKGIALLAGFCEIGETPEETVVREVMEEVCLEVENITYYKSQPWGFDCNLLLGFFADVKGCEDISIDEKELSKAAWVKRSDIEYEEDSVSLTGAMIEAFRTGEY